MSKIAVNAVIIAIDAGLKATATFKKFVGFPDGSPEDMEGQYQLVLDANVGSAKVTKARGDALRSLMSWCRSHCEAPYSKTSGPNGKITPKAPAKAKGVKSKTHKMSDVEPPVVVTQVKETLREPQANEVIDLFKSLANLYLTASDLAILDRLADAVAYGIGRDAKKGKKK